MDELLIEFGNHLRNLRKKAGLSQQMLSFKADLHRNYICDVERGARNVSLKALKQLADGLEVSLMELMNF